MRYIFLLGGMLVLLPQLALAQTGSLQGLISGTLGFIDQVAIPVVLGIAFLFVVWNGVRFFIIGSDNDESQENAKRLALYSVATFVVIISFWGIVKIIGSGIGLDTAPCETSQSDYYRVNRSAPCQALIPPSRPPNVPPMNPGQDPIGAIPSSSAPTNVGGTAYLPVQTAATAARTAAAQYLATDFVGQFGANATIVQNALLADIGRANDPSISERARAEAMFRMTELGAIPDTVLANYVQAVNTYATTINRPDRSLDITAVISNVAAVRSLPASVTTQMISTRSLVTQAFTDYNTNSSPQANDDIIVVSEVSALYNRSSSFEDRYAAAESLRSRGAFGTVSNYNRFIQDLNTERAFAGNYDMSPVR